MIALDTNLLVYAHRAGAPEHVAARSAVERAIRGKAGWGIPLPCLSEFWGVVTHPACAGGPSSPGQAGSFLARLLEDGDGVVWQAGPGFGLRLLQAAASLKVHGPRIFDLQIALMAFEDGATEIWSHDRHFISVPGLKVVDPL